MWRSPSQSAVEVTDVIIIIIIISSSSSSSRASSHLAAASQQVFSSLVFNVYLAEQSRSLTDE